MADKEAEKKAKLESIVQNLKDVTRSVTEPMLNVAKGLRSNIDADPSCDKRRGREASHLMDLMESAAKAGKYDDATTVLRNIYATLAEARVTDYLLASNDGKLPEGRMLRLAEAEAYQALGYRPLERE